MAPECPYRALGGGDSAAEGERRITTFVAFEKLGEDEKSGYAITARRNGTSHKVSFRSKTQILYIAEILKNLSITQGWIDYLITDSNEAKQ
jgi:hypothetical protein